MVNQELEINSLNEYEMERFDANRPVRSVILDICTRHNAQNILGIGDDRQSLWNHLQGAGYNVRIMKLGETTQDIPYRLVPSNSLGLLDMTAADPIKAADFDMAISIESNQFLSKSSSLTEWVVARLRLGGILILLVPYCSYPRKLLITLREWFGSFFFKEQGGDHAWCWTRENLIAHLELHGFKSIEFIGVRGISLQWKTLIFVARKTVGKTTMETSKLG